MNITDRPTPETDSIQGNGIHQVTDAFDHARKLERERDYAIRLNNTLEWKRGPLKGGEGTAGMRDGHGYWWDGDMLLCVVDLTGGGRDVFVGRVQADGDMISLTFPESGDDTGWLPDDLSWYAKIDGMLPPMNEPISPISPTEPTP